MSCLILNQNPFKVLELSIFPTDAQISSKLKKSKLKLQAMDLDE